MSQWLSLNISINMATVFGKGKNNACKVRWKDGFAREWFYLIGSVLLPWWITVALSNNTWPSGTSVVTLSSKNILMIFLASYIC